MSLVGQTVGNYRVINLLGEGGMGVVYLAEHPVIGRKVAIKVLHLALSRDAEVVARFFNEARAIHTIDNEHIVEILDFGQTADGQPYFIMELLGGESMNARLARGPMPAAQVAEIADPICRALHAAHAKGIIHRDLKPHNVQLLPAAGGRTRVKLLDFGVAKIANSGLSDGSQSVKTRTGSLMGTPLYMSPEQCRGSGQLDHRTDIYSLGVMLFEALAGRPPFMAEGAGELFAKHMLEDPPALAELAPEAPRAMVAAIMRSLAKNVDDRFADMEEFRGALLGEVAFASLAPSHTGRSVEAPARANIGGTMVYPSGPPPARGATARAGAGRSITPGSTTLSSTSSEIEDDLRPAQKRRTGLAIAAAVVAGAGALALVFAGRGAPRHAESADPASAATPAQEEPRAPATVTIRFESEPAGAHVFRATDAKDLGAVPLELKLPRDGGRPEYLVRLSGYQDQAVSADLASDRTLRVALEKAAETARTTTAKADPPRKPATARHPVRTPPRGSSEGDPDGLAMPSF